MPEAELSLVFLRPLNQAGIRYLVGGSVAAMLYGEPRFTNDVDVVVFLRDGDVARLASIYPAPEFYLPPAEVIAAEVARTSKGQFNVLHNPTGFKADFFTTGRDELNVWAFRHARRLDYLGEPIVIAPPECVIVRKLEYLREGGSEKHVRDIRTMLRVSDELIDQRELEWWIRERGVMAEWELVTRKNSK